MATSSVRASRAPRRCSAVGMPGSRPPQSLRTPMADEPRVQEVQIGWKGVLRDVLHGLGGEDPVYMKLETSDAMFQVRVRFMVPPGIPPTEETVVICDGNRCFSLWEAEAEVAASSLQQFEWGGLGTRLLDVSRVQCAHLKSKAEHLVLKGGELYRGIYVFILHRCDMIDQAKECHEALCDRMVEDRIHRSEAKYHTITRDVANRLVPLNKGNCARIQELWSRCKELKDKILVAKDDMESHCRVDIVQQAHKKRFQIKLSMRLVLLEMMRSLGWCAPLFTACSQGGETYVFKVEIFPGDIADMENTTTIMGTEMSSEVDAVESAALAAIVFLEKEKDIYVVDITYNRRSNGEHYVCQAEDIVQLATSLANDIFKERNIMLDGLKQIDMECRMQVEMHEREGPCDWMYNVKWECAEKIARVYASCAAGLDTASRRFEACSAWIEE